MKVRHFFWALAALGTILGGLDFITTIGAPGAPQQAAAAAMALCWAIFPYIFARAADEMVRLYETGNYETGNKEEAAKKGGEEAPPVKTAW